MKQRKFILSEHDNSFLAKIGKVISIEAATKGIEFADLAESAGMGPDRMKRLLNGTARTVALIHYQRIAEGLNVPLNALFLRAQGMTQRQLLQNWDGLILYAGGFSNPKNVGLMPGPVTRPAPRPAAGRRTNNTPPRRSH